MREFAKLIIGSSLLSRSHGPVGISAGRAANLSLGWGNRSVPDADLVVGQQEAISSPSDLESELGTGPPSVTR